MQLISCSEALIAGNSSYGSLDFARRAYGRTLSANFLTAFVFGVIGTTGNGNLETGCQILWLVWSGICEQGGMLPCFWYGTANCPGLCEEIVVGHTGHEIQHFLFFTMWAVVEGYHIVH